jgi:hypothetical protein
MSEVTEFGKCAGKSRVAQIRLAGPTFPSTKNSIILIYNCYICILLIKTNSMIYICYIFCKGGVEICVFAVRDNEHDSEHNDEVASRTLPRGDSTGKTGEVTRMSLGTTWAS